MRCPATMSAPRRRDSAEVVSINSFPVRASAEGWAVGRSMPTHRSGSLSNSSRDASRPFGHPSIDSLTCLRATKGDNRNVLSALKRYRAMDASHVPGRTVMMLRSGFGRNRDWPRISVRVETGLLLNWKAFRLTERPNRPSDRHDGHWNNGTRQVHNLLYVGRPEGSQRR